MNRIRLIFMIASWLRRLCRFPCGKPMAYREALFPTRLCLRVDSEIATVKRRGVASDKITGVLGKPEAYPMESGIAAHRHETVRQIVLCIRWLSPAALG